jgi:hypothetical protein
MKHDDLSERLRQHGNFLYGIGTPPTPMVAADFLHAAARIDRLQAELDAAMAKPFNTTLNKKPLALALTLVKDALPLASDYSSSYGGQWSSPWCICLSRSGSANVQRLVLSPNEKEAQDRGELRLYPEWKMSGLDSLVVAWAYVTDAKALLEEKPDAP